MGDIEDELIRLREWNYEGEFVARSFRITIGRNLLP
jgi:hypothetical protein